MLRKSLISLLTIFIFCLQINAQVVDTSRSNSVDSATYSDYLKGDWSKLIEVGDIGLKNNIDYYYLRMRLGIANYYLGNFPKAADHFEKALKYNKTDTNAQLYLYDTYIILGKNTRAYALSKNFTETTSALLLAKRKVPEKLYAGVGYSFSNNYSLNDNVKLNSDGDTVSGFEVLIGDKSLVYGGISLNISPSVSYYLGYNHIQVQKKTVFQYGEAPIVFDSVTNESWGFQNYYTVYPKMYRTTFDHTVKQDELYQNLRFQFGKGWASTVFGNMIFVNTVDMVSHMEDKLVHEINYQVIGEEPVYFDYTYSELEFQARDSMLFNYVVGANIEKDFNNYKLNLYGCYSKLNTGKQYQIGVSSFYYLNKKATVYGITGLTWFHENKGLSKTEDRVIFNQKFGGRIIKTLWGGAEFTYGNLHNSTINNGSIVYNQVDKMKFKGGLNLKLYLGTHFELGLIYNYISYEGDFIKYVDDQDNNEIETVGFEYQTQNLIGSLAWRF